MSLLVRVAALLLAVFLPVAAFAEPVVIRIGFAEVGVGGRQFGTQGGASVAHARTLLEKEFAGEDVTVQWVFFRGAGPAVNEAIAAGQLDLALQGDLPAIVGRANGLKTKLLMGSGVRNNIYLAVRPDAPITGIDDLKGRKVAQFRGTNLQLAADRVLAAHHLTERDIRFLSMDFEAAVAALRSGDIDATFGQADLFALQDQGLAKVVYSTRGDDPTFTRHSHVLVTEAFETAHPELVQRVVTTFVKAADWASDENNRKELFEIWALSGRPVAGFEHDYEGQTLAYRQSPLIDPFLIESYASKIQQAKDYRLLRGNASVEGWFEPKYLNTALKQLGLEWRWTPLDAAGKPVATN
ncbi:ABC transporter substrate-binding protein [Xanthobacter agilis]|uniref:ABC transporter substrate-binding protein n=1 Tax=Xanthobacter agilis TaxID=47492 RepID=UPI00372A6B42